MAMNNMMLDNCFSIRFQNVSETRDPRTADLVVNKNDRKEFFDLVERFGLIAIYTENDVWHIKPNPKTSPQDLSQHTSTWDIMFHKYLAMSNGFKQENEEYFRKKVEVIPLPIQFIMETEECPL